MGKGDQIARDESRPTLDGLYYDVGVTLDGKKIWLPLAESSVRDLDRVYRCGKIANFMIFCDVGWSGIAFYGKADGKIQPFRVYQNTCHIVDVAYLFMNWAIRFDETRQEADYIEAGSASYGWEDAPL